MIEILRKSGIALLVLALALVAQIPHAAHVFDRAPYIGQIVQPDSAWHAWILAYAYAIALESATLMFIVHGHQRASYGFAIASFAVNLSYYSMHKVALFSLPALPVWLLSALLPIAIASYSHILTGAQDVHMHMPSWLWRWAKMFSPKAKALQPVVQPDALHIADADGTIATMQGDVQPDKRTRALQMHNEGLNKATIALEVDAPLSTVQSWIRRNDEKLNGVHKVAA